MSTSTATYKFRVKLDSKFEYFSVDDSNSRSRWETSEAIREVMGTTPTGNKNYPVIPGFLNLARMTVLSHDNVELTEPRIITEHVETDAAVVEEAIKNAILSLNDSNQFNVGNRLQRLIKQSDNLEEVDDISKVELGATIQLLNEELQKTISDTAEKLSKRLKMKIRKKVKKTIEETSSAKSIIFTYPASNGIEIQFQFIGIDAEFIERLLPSIDEHRAAVEQIKRWRICGVPLEERDYEVKGEFPPFDHQWAMYKIHMRIKKSADLSQMGTGKTFSTLMTIDKRIQLGQIAKGKTIIVCPATVMENWVKEIKRHTPHLTARILDGSYKDRLSALMEKDKPDIYIINYEFGAMKWKQKLPNGEVVEIPLTKLMTVIDWQMVVLDECHRIKNPGAKRTGAIIDCFKDVPYAIIMSGTINANKLHDVFMPFVFLNRGQQFNPVYYDYRQQPIEHAYVIGKDEEGKNIIEMRQGTGQLPLAASTLHEHFLDAYFIKNGYNYDARSFTMKDLRRKLEEVSVRFEKSECMSLPPKTYELRLIDMHPDQEKLYVALQERLSADLNEAIGQGGRITMFSIMALMMKLAEAANGWLYDKNGMVMKFPWNPKIEALEELIEELDEEAKVVVWSRFTADIHSIADLLRKKYGFDAVKILHGGISCATCGMRGGERQESINSFNDMTSKVRFVVANPAAGGEGIDLVGASYEIYYANSHNKLHRMQSEDRAHRAGMRDKLTIIDMIMKRTIDEGIYGSLRSWKSMAAALLEHLGIDPAKAEKILGPGDFTLSNEPPVIRDLSVEKATNNQVIENVEENLDGPTEQRDEDGDIV